MRCVLAVLIVLVAAGRAMAEDLVPMILSSEGFLLDGAEKPVSATTDVTFAIYDDGDTAHAPTPLWSETYAVLVSNGRYAVALGDTRAPNNEKKALTASVFQGAQRFLGIKLAGSPELSPRLRIGAVPFAARSAVAAAVDANAIDTAQLKDGSVTPAKLALSGGRIANLDADKLDGLDSSAFAPAAIEGKIDAIKASVGEGLGAAVGGLSAAIGPVPSGSSVLGELASIKGTGVDSNTKIGAATTAIGGVASLLGNPPSNSSISAEIASIKATGAETSTKVGALATSLGALGSALGTPPANSSVAGEVALVKSSAAAVNGRQVYSRDCTDFAAKGWAARQDCLQDGRWHKLVDSTQGVAVSQADVDLMRTLISAGAELKVQITSQARKPVYPIVFTLPLCDDVGHICLYAQRPVVASNNRTLGMYVSSNVASDNGLHWVGVASDATDISAFNAGTGGGTVTGQTYTYFVRQ